MKKPRAAPLFTTAKILEKLKEFPDGITAKLLSEVMGTPLNARLSRLHAYGIIEATPSPARKRFSRGAYLYRTKLPRAAAPPSAMEIETAEKLAEPIS